MDNDAQNTENFLDIDRVFLIYTSTTSEYFMLDFESPRSRYIISHSSSTSANSELSGGYPLNSSGGSLWKIIQGQQQQIAHVQRQIDRILDLLSSANPSNLGLGENRIPDHCWNSSYRDQRGIMKSVRTSTSSVRSTEFFRPVQRALPSSVAVDDDIGSDDEDLVYSAEVEALIRKYSSNPVSSSSTF
jgi:hypothetical protein